MAPFKYISHISMKVHNTLLLLKTPAEKAWLEVTKREEKKLMRQTV